MRRDVPEKPAQNLARGGLWNGVDEVQPPDLLECDPLRHVLDQLVCARGSFQDDERPRDFTGVLIL